jgi:hypothetical protein
MSAFYPFGGIPCPCCPRLTISQLLRAYVASDLTPAPRALFFFRAFSNPWSVLSRGPVLVKTTRYATFGRTVGGLNRRSLNAFETTVTEEKAIAPAAKMGLRRMPKNGKRTPAATGMRMVL